MTGLYDEAMDITKKQKLSSLLDLLHPDDGVLDSLSAIEKFIEDRTGLISPSVEDSSVRNVTFDELVDSYLEQIVGLVDGGADVLIVETIFDTLNAKAALFAIGEYLEYAEVDIPVFVSGTL
eukprot:gene2770-3593_t